MSIVETHILIVLVTTRIEAPSIQKSSIQIWILDILDIALIK